MKRIGRRVNIEQTSPPCADGLLHLDICVQERTSESLGQVVPAARLKDLADLVSL